MKARHKRLTAVLISLLGVGIATAMILTAFDKNLLYYTTPSELLAELKLPKTSDQSDVVKKYHLGGMVKEGSVVRVENTLDVSFVLTDYTAEVSVTFDGILPDLFREKQGIIAIGTLQTDGSMKAEKVLAKHDENYMPPNIKAKPSELSEPTLSEELGNY